MAVNPNLRHPLNLGTNWPAFNHLLGYLCADVSWKIRRGGGHKGGRGRVSARGTESFREADPHRA